MAFTVYDLKPRFQKLLRPIVAALADRGYTANQITVAAMVLSVFYGALLYMFPIALTLLGLPLVLLVRMALNAIDGMLAREHNQQSQLGGYLNEAGDIVSDLALYIPFLVVFATHPITALVFSVFLIGLVITEVVGIMTLLSANERRYDGPMGKSDRALWMSVCAVTLALWPTAGLGVLMMFATALALGTLITIKRRYERAHQKVG